MSRAAIPAEHPLASGNNPLENYLTDAQLAQAIGKSRRTLKRWADTGMGPSRIKIGNLILYSKQSITEFLQDRETGRPRRRSRKG